MKQVYIDASLEQLASRSGIAIFLSPHGEERYDFRETCGSNEWARFFASYMVETKTTVQANTRRQVYYRLCKFAQFLLSRKVAAPRSLAYSTVSDYYRHLLSGSYETRTVQSMYAHALSTLKWARDHSIGIGGIEPDLIKKQRARRTAKTSAQIPTSEVVNAYLKAAYRQIDEASSRILRSGEVEECEVRSLLAVLTNNFSRPIPRQKEQNYKERQAYRRLSKQGTPCSFLGPCPDDVIAFFIAILIQTAGNPLAVWQLRSDCLVKTSAPYRTRIDWEKPRARKTQTKGFDIRVKRAAPNLVELFLTLSDWIRKYCSHTDKNKLFITYSNKAKIIHPREGTLYVMLRHFQKRHSLPAVELRSFRRHSASSAYIAEGLVAAQATLNHSSARTTTRYIDKNVMRERDDKVIASFQGEFVDALSVASENDIQIADNGKAYTSFGFDCKDPLGGMSPHGRRGELCRSFLSCFSCPGAIIPTDDPEITARIHQAHDHLSDAKVRMLADADAARRFRAAYQPLLRILRDEVIPRLTGRRDEELIAQLPPLPPIV